MTAPTPEPEKVAASAEEAAAISTLDQERSAASDYAVAVIDIQRAADDQARSWEELRGLAEGDTNTFYIMVQRNIAS